MARFEMWGLKLVALVAGLLVMVPETTQISIDHPLYGLVQRMNVKEGPFLGMVLSDSDSDEKLFFESGYFVPRSDILPLVISGRKFYIGVFRGVSAVAVRAYGPLANVGATAQLLMDTFTISGIITYGKAGVTGDKLDIPNVAIPTHVAYTGVWNWEEYVSPLRGQTALPSLKFGDYNVPTPGENALGSVQFQEVTKYTPKGSKKNAFWFYIDPKWLNIANQIEGTELERCINGTICSDSSPVIIRGLRTGSSDIFVENVAYGKFLSDKLNVAAVDTVSAAVVSTAVANGLPSIVFRAASNKPGAPWDQKLDDLAGQHVLKVVVAFVDRLTQLKVVQPRIASY